MHKLRFRIVVPTDFSARSGAAFTYAMALAQSHGAKVAVAHAIDPLPYSFGVKASRERKRRELWEAAQARMIRWVREAGFPGVEHVLLEGEAGPAIAEFSREKDVGLIVLGTTARSHAARLVLGSVAEEIFRQAGCPVLVLGPKSRSARSRLKRLVFATDLESHSLAVLPRLSKLAEKFDSRIWVVRAGSADAVSDSERSRIRRETRQKFGGATDSTIRERIEAVRVEFGQAAKIIVRFARKHRGDAIVMGIRGASGLDRAATHIPWTLAHRVIANAPCPILTLRG